MSKHIYYDPTYFAEKDPTDTKCTLMIRIYDKHKTRSGRYSTTIKRDTIVYPDESAMAADIKARHMQELPPEAEGNRMYIPPTLHSANTRLS